MKNYFVRPHFSDFRPQAGLVSVGAVLHMMVRPVHSKYFDISDQIDTKEQVAEKDRPIDAENKILEK